MTLCQIAYLSARPDVLAQTHAYVRHFMPWLTKVVVVTPRRTAKAVTALGSELSSELTVLTDEELLEPGTDPSGLDHQMRNLLLRVALCRSGTVDEVFLCADDDYRPLKAVSRDRFVRTDADGRERLAGFTFYDLLDWTADATDFDRGQQNTLQVLAYLGAEQRAYASHMPQAIDKAVFLEAVAMARRVAPTISLCEWSVYGNLGRQLAPERFAPPEPYLTLAWPEYPNQWRRAVVPHEYAFENFYPQLYEPGHLFAGLPTALDPTRVEQDAVEKLLRWRRLDLAIRRLDVPADIVSPWTTSSRLRRAYFRALRPARKTMDLLMLGERAADHAPVRPPAPPAT